MKEMTWNAIVTIARSQHGVLGVHQALAAGISRQTLHRAVRQGRLRRVGRGVVALAASPPSLTQRLMAAHLHLGQDSVVSHRAAALLHGLDGVYPVVELSAPRWMDVPGAVVHERTRLPELDVCRIGPLPVTGPLHTLGDLGAVVDLDTVERSLESAIRKGLVTDAELRTFAGVTDWRGCRGMGVLQRVLDRRPVGAPPTGSDAETVCVQILRDAGEPDPVRQHPVVDESGQLIGFVDLAYPDLHLGWEVDGFAVHGTPQTLQYDLNRQNRILATGMRLLRFTAIDVYQRPNHVVRTIRSERLRAAGTRRRRSA